MLGLGRTDGELLYCKTSEKPRSCIFVTSGVSYLLMNEFCCRDLVAIRLKHQIKGGERQFVIASAYFPYDDEEPPGGKLSELVEYCARSTKPRKEDWTQQGNGSLSIEFNEQ